MVKPKQEYIFREIDDCYRDAGTGKTFVEFLDEYELQFDDRTEFLRFRDYEREEYVWIRAGYNKIRVTIWDERQS